MVACARPDLSREDELLASQQRQEEANDPSTMLTSGEEENNNNNDTTIANDWPTAEGYTPLGDAMNFEGNVMFSMPPMMNSDDGGDDDEEQADFSNNNATLYSSGPNTFVANPAELFRQQQQHSEDENPETTDQTISNLDEGYRDVANLALLALEEDYQRTLRGQIQSSPLQEQQPPSVSDMPRLGASSYSTALASNGMESFADFTSPEADLNDTTENEGFNNNKNPTKEIPNIDTEAVKQAVAGIIHNTSDKFSHKMKQWQQDHQQKKCHQQHSVIPAVPLKAFRKETPKAIQATANMTRSATIAETLHRISELLQSQDCLSIHVVGADPVECESPERIRTHFAPLARWINANIYSPHKLSLSLVGPNIPSGMATPSSSPIDLLKDYSQTQTQQARRLHSATAQCYEASYHDWLQEQQRDQGNSNEGSLPDVIFCFNAGIWGYDEWKPTVRSVIQMKRHIPFVVTSYTLYEAEDDHDVIEGVFEEVSGKKEDSDGCTDTGISHADTASTSNYSPLSSKRKQGCLWKPEANAFGSKQKRETATAVEGREYRENAAWQAWRF